VCRGKEAKCLVIMANEVVLQYTNDVGSNPIENRKETSHTIVI
jgi:hypothetical protein